MIFRRRIIQACERLHIPLPSAEWLRPCSFGAGSENPGKIPGKSRRDIQYFEIKEKQYFEIKEKQYFEIKENRSKQEWLECTGVTNVDIFTTLILGIHRSL